MKKLIIVLGLFTTMIQAQTRQIFYQETLNQFSNPERGLYYEISTKPDDFLGAYRPLSDVNAQGDLQDALDHGISLIHFIIRLDQFKTTNVIPAQFLIDIGNDFGQLRAKGLKCILRFCYSSYKPDPITGNLDPANVYEPSIDVLLGVPRLTATTTPAVTMPGHINQLAAVTRANQDVISSIDAGFIGNWGEWYYSHPTNSSFGVGNPTDLDSQSPTTTFKNNRTELANALMGSDPNTPLLSGLAPKRMIAFRTPYFQKLLAPNLNVLKLYPRYNDGVFSRTAAHNDAFTHDLLDSGTYRDLSDNGAGDRSYLASKSRTTFTGGESNENDHSPYSSCTILPSAFTMTSLDQLKEYHYNHLNYSYFEEIMDPVTGLWVTTSLPTGGNCLDEVKRKLGYRFVLVDSNVNPTSHTITVHLRNDGFANVFNPRNVNLVLKNTSGTYRFNMQGPVDTNNVLAPGYSTNIRAWYAGTNITLSRSLTSMVPIGGTSVIPNGTYDMYIEIPDETITTKKDLYSIRFANANTYTKVTSGPTFSGTFWDAANGFNNLFQTVTITSGTGSKMASDDMLAFNVISSPNPFADNFKLSITTSSKEPVSIKVYDMLGKLIEDKTVNTSELENLEVGSKLAIGIYNVVIKQGENEKTLRVIKN